MLKLDKDLYKQCLRDAVKDDYGEVTNEVRSYANWCLSSNIISELNRGLFIGNQAYRYGCTITPEVLAKDIIVYCTIMRQFTLGRTLEALGYSDNVSADIQFLMSALVDTTRPYTGKLYNNDTKKPIVGSTIQEDEIEDEVVEQVLAPTKILTYEDVLMDRDKHRLAQPLQDNLLQGNVLKDNRVKTVKQGDIVKLPYISRHHVLYGGRVDPLIDGSYSGIAYLTDESVGPEATTLNRALWDKARKLDDAIIAVSKLSLQVKAMNASNTSVKWRHICKVKDNMTNSVNAALKYIMRTDIHIDNILTDYHDLMKVLFDIPSVKDHCRDILTSMLSVHTNIISASEYQRPLVDMVMENDGGNGIITVHPFISFNVPAIEVGLDIIPEEGVLLSGKYHKALLDVINDLYNTPDYPDHRGSMTTLYTKDATYEIYNTIANYVMSNKSYIIRRAA